MVVPATKVPAALCGVRGIDLLGEICDRDGRDATDDQPFEEAAGEE